jgi:hypothetical protein
VLHDDIGHIREEHRLPDELMAANTEVHFSVWEHLSTIQNSNDNHNLKGSDDGI